MSAGPQALVLGGYGLIGAACGRALGQAGFAVTGIGRSAAAAAQAGGAAAHWIIRDIAAITAEEWRAILAAFDSW